MIIGSAATLIGAADAKGLAVFISEFGTAIALIDIPFAVGTSDYCVQRVVVLPTVESGEKVLPLIDFRVEP